MFRYLAVLMLTVVGAHDLFACSCNHSIAERPCGRLQNQSEMIFVGTVSAGDNPPDPSAYRIEAGQARYSFHVEESISGLDVYSGRECCDCSIGFQIGAKYLVDAWRGKIPFSEYSGKCMAHIPIREATNH